MSAQVNIPTATIEASIEIGLSSAADAAGTMRDFDKPAGKPCPHQRHGKGCSVYSTRPFGCRFWNCRWLGGDDTDDLQRPDRSHYVVDISPDYVTTDDENGNKQTVPVVQIWIDGNYPDAHRDPALRAFLERRAAEGMAALVRYNAIDALFIAAPALNADRQWHEHRPKRTDAEPHSVLDKVKALGPMKLTLAAKI
jgi:hypothetical protein